MNHVRQFRDWVDPDFAKGLARYEKLGLAEHQQLTEPVIRLLRARGDAFVEQFLAGAPRNDEVLRDDQVIHGPAGDLLVRVYRPRVAAGPLPALVWLHGGE